MFIVLEGLDGVGKSTLIKGLREAIDAKTIRTPAPWMSAIRTDFEDMSDEITSSYYDLCNKVASEDVKIVKVGQLFVIDMQLVLHLDVFQSALSVATSNHFTSDHYTLGNIPRI